MAKYEMQGRHQSFPVAFRPAEPDEELAFLVGKPAELNRPGCPRVVILGVENVRGVIRCFCRGVGFSGWFPLETVDLDTDEVASALIVPLDVFG